SRWIPLLRFMQDALKRLIIARLLEERQARHRPIEYVVDQPTGRDASVSWHATKLTAADLRVNETSCAPFSSASTSGVRPVPPYLLFSGIVPAVFGLRLRRFG